MRRVGMGVEKNDGQALSALRDQGGDLGQRGLEVKRDFNTAIGGQAFARLSPPGAIYKGPRHGQEDVVEFVFPFAADLQHIAEACGGDQRGARALALDQRIGEERGRMHHTADLGRQPAGAAQDLQRPRQRTARRVVGRGAFLPDVGAAGGGVVQDEIGEGAADIDTQRQ